MTATTHLPLTNKIVALDFRARNLSGVYADEIENEVRSIMDDLTHLPAVDAMPVWEALANALLDAAMRAAIRRDWD